MDELLDKLNEEQRKPVADTEGAVLVLAGAGSGKTRVLTSRIAYILREGKAALSQILAITFTNKAAREMRERVDALTGHGAADVWISTFHSACVRILRREIHHLDYDNQFSIYDTDDQRVLMRQILKSMNLDSKRFRERNVLSVISGVKNELITPDQFIKDAEGDWYTRKVGEVL